MRSFCTILCEQKRQQIRVAPQYVQEWAGQQAHRRFFPFLAQHRGMETAVQDFVEQCHALVGEGLVWL